MFTFTEAGENYVLSLLFDFAGVQFCLATDASLTEVTDEAYSRVDLQPIMEVSGGAASLTEPMYLNTGEQVASWWFITDASGEIPVLYGPLPSPVSGSFALPAGGLLAQAVAG